MSKICSVEGCDNLVTVTHGAHGMCGKHYMRWKVHGHPSVLLRNSPGVAKSNPELYKTWLDMKSRCYRKKEPNYDDYGGRGIKVCDRWLGVNGFTNFFNDMGKRPELMYMGKSFYSLDRIDVNGDYCPENCRWATIYDQANNRRNNINIEHNGNIHTLKEWSHILGLSYPMLFARYKKYGWRGDRLFEPSHKSKRG